MQSIDRQRFEAVFDDHGAAILAYALRRTGRAAAEDVLSETFLVAWRRREELPSDPLPWLYGVARNQLLNQRRIDGRRVALVHRMRRERGAPHNTDTAEDGPLMQALRTLQAPDREVLLLDAWEGLSSEDAGLALGCTPEAYRARLSRAKKRLRAAVELAGAAPVSTGPTAEATP